MDHLCAAGLVARHRLARRKGGQEAAGAAAQGSGFAPARVRRPPAAGHELGEHDPRRSRRGTRRQAPGPTGRASPPSPQPPAAGGRFVARDTATHAARRTAAAGTSADRTAGGFRQSRSQTTAPGAGSYRTGAPGNTTGQTAAPGAGSYRTGAPGNTTGQTQARTRTNAAQSTARVEDRVRPQPPRARTRQAGQETTPGRDGASPEAAGPRRRADQPRVAAQNGHVSRDSRHAGRAAGSTDLGALVDARTTTGRVSSRQMAARSRHGYTRRPCRPRPRPRPIHLQLSSSPPAHGG